MFHSLYCLGQGTDRNSPFIDLCYQQHQQTMTARAQR